MNIQFLGIKRKSFDLQRKSPGAARQFFIHINDYSSIQSLDIFIYVIFAEHTPNTTVEEVFMIKATINFPSVQNLYKQTVVQNNESIIWDEIKKTYSTHFPQWILAKNVGYFQDRSVYVVKDLAKWNLKIKEFNNIP